MSANMKIETESYFDVHFFVCCNERDGGKASCGPSGGKWIKDRLKEEVKKAQKEMASEDSRKKIRVRVNQAGCLGRCDEGVVAVNYPSGEWVLNAEPTEEVIQKLVAQILKT